MSSHFVPFEDLGAQITRARAEVRAKSTSVVAPKTFRENGDDISDSRKGNRLETVRSNRVAKKKSSAKGPPRLPAKAVSANGELTDSVSRPTADGDVS